MLARIVGVRPYRRRRLRLWSEGVFALGVLIATVAGAVTYEYVEFVRATAAAPAPTTPVVIAAHDLQPRTRLAAEDLVVAALPPAYAPPDAIRSIDDLVGRVTATRLAANEPVLTAKLVPVGANQDFSLLRAGERVSASMPDVRALSIALPDSAAVAGAVGPGDIVDILVTGRVGSDGNGDLASRIAFTRVEILARDKTIYTIRVDAADAEKIAYLEASGAALRFLLRAPGDDRTPRATGADSTVVAPLLRVGGAR